MKKGFVILVGDNTAKSLLEEMLKEKFWVWDVSPLRNLRKNASLLGWEFDGTESSNEYIHRFMELSNDFFDYEYNHVKSYLDKTIKSTKAEENNKEADILIISQINSSLIERLQDEFKFFVLHVNMGNVVEDNFEDGKFVLGLGDTSENVKKSLSEIFNLIIQ